MTPEEIQRKYDEDYYDIDMPEEWTPPPDPFKACLGMMLIAVLTLGTLGAFGVAMIIRVFR